MPFGKRFVPIFLLTQAAFVLIACAPDFSAPASATTQPIPEITASPSPPTAPTASPTPKPTQSNKVNPEEDTPSSEIPLSPLLCSPLAVQPLETLTEIITQPFIAPRQLDDGTYKDDGHHGLDLGYYTRNGIPFTGTPVQAATSGKIAAILKDRPPYGDALLIETPYAQIPPHLLEVLNISTGDSLYTLYAHLQNLQPFSLNEVVLCGQMLAESGLTGYTSGPHLHIETRWGPAGQTFESMAYYDTRTSEEERANYVTWRMSGKFQLFDPLRLLKLAE